MRPVAAPWSLLLLAALAAARLAAGAAPASGSGVLARLHSGPAGAEAGAGESDAELGAEREKEHHAFVDRYPVTRFDWAQVPESDDSATTLKLPLLLDRFDWIVSEKSIVRQRGDDVDPTTVYCNDSLQSVRTLLVGMDQSKFLHADKKRRVLVINGGVTWMSESVVRIPENPYWWPPWQVPQGDSQQARRAAESYRKQRNLPSSRKRLQHEYERMAHWFQVVFIENKDMDFKNMRTMPVGLSEPRLLHGSSTRASKAMVATELDTKDPGVLVPSAPKHEIRECGNGWGEAQVWRDQFRNWTTSEAALNAGVVTLDVRAQQWWDYLARYRFLLAPPSCEVQSPAIVEALLMLTVPIVRRGPYAALEDLERYGFPVLVVHDLGEIEGDMLEKKWQQLSPRLEKFRSKCLNSEAYWRLITGVFDDQDECWPALD